MKSILVLILLLPAITLSKVDLSGPVDNSVIEKYKEALSSTFGLLPHNETYLMPISYNASPDVNVYNALQNSSELRESRGDFYDKIESEFQISFMLPISKNIFSTQWNLNVAYTHHAWWQVYNDNWSRPFRETNYTPEIFIRKIIAHEGKKFYGINILGYGLGYMHQSNGQIQELSRSWDRIVGRVALGTPSNLIELMAWVRIDDRGQKDDNPKILDFLGHGSIKYHHQVFETHRMGLKLIPGRKHLSYKVDYSVPWKDRLNWYVKYESGFGHSLIEYNKRSERVALGLIVENVL